MHQLVNRLVGFFPNWFPIFTSCLVCCRSCLHIVFISPTVLARRRACRFHSSAVVRNEARKGLIRKMGVFSFFFQIYCALFNVFSLFFALPPWSFLFECVHVYLQISNSLTCLMRTREKDSSSSCVFMLQKLGSWGTSVCFQISVRHFRAQKH